MRCHFAALLVITCGLRDYGTAEWEGGDPNCDHKRKGVDGPRDGTTTLGSRATNQNHEREPWKNGVCGKCGAVSIDEQIGLERTPQEYVDNLVAVFAEAHRVLRDDGTFWLNLGDSYANDTKWGGLTGGKHATALHGNSSIGRSKRDTGLKAKDLVGIPWRVALALQEWGWYLRSDIIWHAPNKMPESVTDRPSKAHEYIFLLTKRERYYYDAESIKDKAATTPHSPGYDPALAKCYNIGPMDRGGKGQRDQPDRVWSADGMRNKRSVWTVPVGNLKEAHFATFPPKLIEPCILAGTSEKGCCPHCGAPWRRVVEKDRQATRPGTNTKLKPHHKALKNLQGGVASSTQCGGSTVRQSEPLGGLVTGNRDPQRHVTKTITKGWEQGCQCLPHDPIPCTVIDCFGGAGTVALVSWWHKRSFIHIDLNSEYIEMAKARLQRAKNKKPTGFFDIRT